MARLANGVELARDLSIINTDRRTLPGPQLLHELVAQPLEGRVILDFLLSTGERLALTYRHFHRLTEILARDINDQLPSKLDGKHVIPVIIPQCPELYIAWVAVLRAGAAFCPVSHDIPPERLKFIIRDVGASLVLTTSKTLEPVRRILGNFKSISLSLETLDKRAVSLEHDACARSRLPDVHPSQPAYVMYTSGSTGMPKGVMVSHLSVTQSLLAHDEHIPRFKRFLQFASPTFDVSIFEIFFPFFRGVTLVGCEREHMLSDLPATIRLLDADAAELTPTVAGTLLKSRDAAPCLRTLLTIGEMLTPRVVSEFGGNADRPSMLYAMYGPTEAAIHCTIAPRLASDASVRSIGRPLQTVTAFILKESDHPEIAPFGEAGELAVAGQLADGYLNRPDQNKSAFVHLSGHGSIYRTGDRAKCRRDGGLEILGRMTTGQVKLRGQRVELGEIEEVALKTEGVQVAVATIIDDILVLFCSANQEIQADNVLNTCKSWLPSYMRPGEIVMLPGAVPRLPSGKVDRKALERYFQRSHESVRGDDFVNDTERNVASIIQAEIGRKLGRSTSLWSLGLDSLRAIKVASRLRQEYTQLDAVMVMEAETVAELSTLITSSKTERESEPFVSASNYMMSEEWVDIEESLRGAPDFADLWGLWEKIVPCSSMQIAMLAETAARSSLNFNQIRLKLAPDVTYPSFRRALDLLAKRNEILRSGFVPTGKQDMPFAQVVWRSIPGGDLSILRPLQLAAENTVKDGEILIQIHHALYDGWSWEQVMDDLNAILSGDDLPHRRQFSEYSSYQRSLFLTGGPVNKEYWREVLRDFVPSTFPTLCSTRPQFPAKDTLLTALSISYHQLSDTARALHCSRETMLEAAWSVLLSSYVDSSDVTVGVVFAGRHLPLPGVESIIGPCLSTLPLRVDISTLRTVRDLFTYLQRQRARSLRFGNVPLRDINRATGSVTDQKLFDTLCIWQETGEASFQNRSKVVTVRHQDALDYAVILEFEPQDGKINLKLTFDTSLIPEPHARLLAAQLDHIAVNMLQAVELELHQIWNGLSKEILSLSNAQPEQFSEKFGLTTTISNLARTDPARVAVEFIHAFDPDSGRVERESLTYSDLFRKASHVAGVLRTSYGIREDDIVAFVAPRSIELYVGILGVIMAGAGYLCIDPRTPSERIRSIFSDSACRVVLTAQKLDSELQHCAQSMASIAELLQQPSVHDWQSWPDLRGSQLAYAVFTSGSTGTPKGVLVTRKNLLSNLEELSRLYPCMPEADRLLQACSPAFDVSVFEIFWTWHMGMRLCTASNDVLLKDLERFVNALDITHLSMTPSVAALVHPDRVPHVKMLVTAGEPMNSRVFMDWADHGLFQGYGPSETTNICNIRPNVTKLDASNNVGPPLPNTSIFVCKRQKPMSTEQTHHLRTTDHLTFEAVPKGGVGEVWIGGEQVGRGYIDPVLTARAFFHHPEYGRLYRSGDIGRLLADGSLTILGREDDQVKLRGQRIELGEINSSLVRCEEVEDAVSMILNEGHNTRLVAFWAPRQSEQCSPLSTVTRNIFRKLGHVLPSYMLPDALVRLDQVPLTRQGKIDRRSLTAVYQNLEPKRLQEMSKDNDSSGDADHLSEHEGLIAHAISSVLGAPFDDINRNSSFYALGLDSISAIRVAQSLRVHFPSVEISTILKHPSIGQLMATLADKKKDNTQKQSEKDLDSIFDGKWKSTVSTAYAQAGLLVDRFLPCTPLQEAMITGSMDSSTHGYQNTLRFEVRGDLSTLREAWAHAVARHELLRTGFVSTELVETPFAQVVLKNLKLPWLNDGDLDISTQGLPSLMLPPWRLTASQQDSNNLELTLEIHHCLYDAEAMSVLLTEIQYLYHGQQLLSPVPFDHYLRFMLLAQSDEADRFWRGKLNGVLPSRVAELIKHEDKAPKNSTSISVYTATLSLSIFKKCVRNSSSTALAIFQSAWSRLLCCLLARQDICFGNVLSGRNLPIEGVDRIVGPCFNTIPMRIQLQHEQSNLDLIHGIQHMNVELLPYQPTSLRRIQRQNSHDGKALFDTLLLFQHEELQVDQQIWTLLEESGDMPFPFILEILMHDATDAITFKLHSQSANEGTLTQLLNGFDAILIHTVRFPQARALDYSSSRHLLPRLKPKNEAPRGADPASELQTNGLGDESLKLSGLEELVKNVLMQLKPDILGSITRNTSVYRLGFDSISAVQIAARLRKQGYDISSADILEAVTVKGIAAVCESKREPSHPPLAFDLEAFDGNHRLSICLNNKIDEGMVQAIRPCTPTQSGILSQYLCSGFLLYFNSVVFQLDDDVDMQRLREAWETVQRLHEMLRTGFVETENPHYPFSMVTYRANTAQLPWIERGSHGGRPTDEPGHRNSMTEPQWRLFLFKNASPPILELSMLHALYDATSLDIILRDVSYVYWGKQVPKPVALAPVVSGVLALSSQKSSRKFWLDVSADLCPTHFPDLRVFFNKGKGFHVASRRAQLSCEAAEQACAHAGASMHAVCATAWALLLSAYTAQTHVTFGLIMSGRDFEQEEQNMVAFPCINTLPFAIEVSQDWPDLLKRATRRCAGVMRYQHTPLNSIKRWVGIEDDLFDTVIVLQKYDTVSGPKRPWTVIDDEATGEYAVSLEIIPNSENYLDFQLTFRDDIVPPEQAGYILDEFDATFASLLGFAYGVSTLKSLLSIIPANDERIATEVRYLHEFVEMTAEDKPQSTALEFVTSLEDASPTKETWTYSKLNSNGNRIAHLLQSKGVEVGELVGVCFDKCPEASFAILGVLKAGCGYVAIDPGAPRARKEFILRDSRCKVVLTSNDKIADFPSGTVAVLAVEGGSWLQLPDVAPTLCRPLEAEDTCYCLYTSGTTGTPKGCLISHDSAVQAMLAFQRIFEGRWDEKSRWLQFASFHFDVSVLEQFWSWSVGICVTSAPRDLMFEDLPGFINALKITHLDLTPSLARLLTPEDVPSLCQGVFIVGGEQVRQDILEMWGDTHCLYNFYGPSEVTIGCTVHPQVPKDAKPTNIGRQWDNVGSFVLDPDSQNPVLRGGVGELCLSGPLVGKGYLNRPELTAERFVTLTEYNTRVYRTGDLVRLLHDNSFEFMGRIDDQVKLRGQRLEIGEINHVALSAAPGLRDVVTMVIKHPKQQKDQLVTFFSTEQRKAKNQRPSILWGTAATELAAQIQQRCTDKLPAYMVPTYFLAVSSIPLSVNNKVDHKALKALFESSAFNPGERDSGKAPADNEAPKEVKDVIEVLAAFLRIPPSSVKSDSRLFELGLDSISAIGLSRAFKSHGFHVTDVATVLRHPVVRDLARAMNRKTTSDHSRLVTTARDQIKSFAATHYQAITQVLGVTENDIECIAPCSPLQEGMVSKALRSEPENAVYFSRFSFELASHIDLGRLRQAWDSAQKSISILRTYFIPTPNGVAQVVLRRDQSGVAFTTVDNGNEGHSALADPSFRGWVQAVLSLSQVLPWRIELVNSCEKNYMVLDIFHGLYDGTSLSLLLHMVARLYENPAQSVRVAMQFYETLPHGALLSLPDEKDFWLSRLGTLQPFRLPRALPSHGLKTSHICLTQRISHAGLQEFCRKLDVTTSAYFQASFLHVLQRIFNVNPLIGVVVSGRALSDVNADDVVGPMFNTVPFGFDHLKKGSTVADLVRACHQFNVDVVPYQHSPLRRVAKYFRQTASADLFDVLFVFQKPPSEGAQNDLWHEIPSQSRPDYPLNVEVEQQNDKFTITVVAKPEYLSEDTARRLLSMYIDTVNDLEAMRSVLPEDFCKAQPGTMVNGTHATIGLHSVDALIADRDEALWGETELAIRTQLAKMASIDEDTIRLHKPNIFELGLDSVEAMKLAARLKDAGLRVLVSAIMRSPTVAGIAKEAKSFVESPRDGTHRDQEMTSISEMQARYRQALQTQGVFVDNVEKILPVTPMQEGLLFEAEKYLHTMVFQLKPGVSTRRLKEAWERACRLEPVLRTRFASIEAVELQAAFVQYITKADDLVEVAHGKGLTEMLQVTKEDAAKGDLRYHKARVHIFTDHEGQSFLLLTMPHALYDAWSLHLLHQKITTLYHNTVEVERPSTTVPYERHLQDVFIQAHSDDSKGFWRKQLSNIEASLLRTNPSYQEQSSPSFLLQARSSKTLFETLKFCQQQGVTLQSLGLACWSVVLAHYIGRVDICFGLVLSGRTTEGSDQLIFPTFNTVVFRPMISEYYTKWEALKAVHDAAVRVSEYQQYPLREAIRYTREQGAGAELFDTLFTFQKLPESKDDTLSLYDEVSLKETVIQPPYRFNIELEGQTDSLVWTVCVQAGIAERSFGEKLLQQLESVLASFIDAPNDHLSRKDDTGASLCGLPSIQMASQSSSAETNDESNSPGKSAGEDKVWTSTEMTIRDILAEVSRTDKEQIKKTIGFFHLGLDSVSAIKVAGLLKKKGLRLPVSEIIKAQTIERMAAVADMSKADGGVGDSVANGPHNARIMSPAVKSVNDVPNHDIEDILPCTGGQIYMLDMWSASKGRLFYPKFWLQVTGVTASTLQKAFDKVADQLPILRTTFVSLEEDGHKSTWQVVLSKGAARQYQLPWSMHVRAEGDGLLLTLQLHHALYDAVSFQLIISALQRLCKDANSHVSPNTSMQEFISATTANRDKAKEFWTTYLEPNDHYSPSRLRTGSFESDRIEKFDAHVLQTTLLHARLKHHGLSLQALFFAAYARVYSTIQLHSELNAQTAQSRSKVVMGIYLANRSLDIEGLTELTAPSFNIVPLKVQLGDQTLLETALQIQHDLAEIAKTEHCGVSMRDIYSWTKIKVDTFVNFLALPDSVHEYDTESKGDTGVQSGDVTITHAQVDADDKSRVNHVEPPSPFLRDSKTQQASTTEWCLVRSTLPPSHKLVDYLG